MKQRFTYLDIRAIVNELSSILPNSYIQNIYSSSNRLYTFKLSTKHNLILEVGARLHLVESYTSDKQTFFCTKMRKLLRHNVFKSIAQIGFDRVIKIETNKVWIYLEFYSTGNIVITDFEDNIVELFRPVKDMGIEKGTKYVTNPVDLMFEIDVFYEIGLKEMLGVDKVILDDIRQEFDEKLQSVCCGLKMNGGKDVIVSNGNELDLDMVKKSEDVLNVYDKYFTDLISKFSNLTGFGALISLKNKPNNFIPYKIRQNENITIYTCLNEALKVYFHKEEVKDVKKSNVVKQRQEKRIQDLIDSLKDYDKKVEMMYLNKDVIDKILVAHMNVIKYNLKWKDFEFYRNKQEDLTDFICKSDFTKKTVTVRLKDDEDTFFIELYFMKTFEANINLIFEERKKAGDKLEKTKGSIKKVIKILEKKEGKKKVVKEKITRKIFWFEKFNYCFTKNKKLILSGKNAQQNDILVKKYLTSDDLFFHADIHGASSIILKDGAKFKDEKCIEEAGLVSLCMSNAWKNKVSASVYYVESDQVSKMANPGEYLKTGAFMIRGKKNYVDVFRLEYGICLVFKPVIDLEDIDNLNIENHSGYNFISNPGNDDNIEFGMVLVAPWSTIKDYKYKEKLLPGSEKKSKLVASIMKNFTHIMNKATNEKEINAVKNVTVMEYMNVIISNCKIGKQ